MSKTLGQVAYEAWERVARPQQMDWESHGDMYRMAWQAAAEAVLSHADAQRHSAHIAVIEAVKALIEAEAMDFDGGEPLTPAEQILVRAVEALQEEEGD